MFTVLQFPYKEFYTTALLLFQRLVSDPFFLLVEVSLRIYLFGSINNNNNNNDNNNNNKLRSS